MPSAGEVEQYGYCAHNWWLARSGHSGASEGSRRATLELQRIGESFHEAARLRRNATSGLTWSFRILGVAAAATLVTIAAVTFQANLLGFVYLTCALVVLNCSVGLWTIALHEERKARRIQEKTGLAAEPLPNSPVLHDEAWNLSGRLDYVLQAGDKLVPILVKSGHTPAHVHDNHALHLAVQLRLLEARGTPAAYGLVTYPQGIFRVEWDDAMKTRLKDVIDAMARARETGKADRDHSQPGRCKGCARRDVCEQKLA